MMRTFILNLIFMLLLPTSLTAAMSRIDIQDRASLQRGAKLYMNYCSGCHSLNYLRYNTLAKGLGLDEELLKNNLIFTQAGVNEPIRIALPPEDARQWFGIVPPDLSLIVRAKGTTWIYDYLQAFYQDKARSFGTNNVLKPGVAMPNILEPLFGEKILIGQGAEAHVVLGQAGELNPQQIDIFLQDLLTFLAYVSEPTKTERLRLGGPVLLFLLIFFLVAWRLKKVYWQKITKL